MDDSKALPKESHDKIVQLVDSLENEAERQRENSSSLEDCDSLEFEEIDSFVVSTNTPTLDETTDREGFSTLKSENILKILVHVAHNTVAPPSEFSDDPLLVIGEKVYNEFQWSDSDQSEIDFELPLKPLEENGKLPKANLPNDNKKNKIKYIKIKSGNIVKKIRINFNDISVYFNKVERLENYKKFLKMIKHLVDKKGAAGEQPPNMVTPDESELQGMTEEEKAQQRELWQQELAQIEEEIQTLKPVLLAKQKASQELKRKLGISVWKELTDDLSQGVRNVKESNVYHHVEQKFSQLGKAVADAPIYQKTESVMRAASESTRSIIGGLTGGFTQKIGQLKNSESFRSIEEKVGSAYENVKTKVSSSRSSSVQSFNEALREETANRNTNVKSPTSPAIPEGKQLS